MAQFPATISLNKSSYEAGELMTLTVTYDNVNKTGLCRCYRNNVLITSTPAKIWTKISDNGLVAVFTSTA